MCFSGEMAFLCWIYDNTVDYSPFMGIEKGAVLQEARVFNDPQLDARRCSQAWCLFCCAKVNFILFW